MSLDGLLRDVRYKIVRCLDMYNEDKASLLVGETGVGKSFPALEFHKASEWIEGNFIRVDLSRLPL